MSSSDNIGVLDKRKNISTRLKELRNRKGLSQENFAKGLGIPYKTYQQWEYEKTTAPDYVVSLIERVVNLEIETKKLRGEDTTEGVRLKKRYYNNGVENLMLLEGEEIPEGFTLGMVKRGKEELEVSNKKRKKTNLEKYGVEVPLQSESIREKVKQTNIEKYGVENVLKVKEFQDKRKSTMVERFGVEQPMYSDDIKKKLVETLNKRYGVDNVFEIDDVKEKCRNTNIEKYGYEWNCLRPEARNYSKNSKVNDGFAKILESSGIYCFEREFVIGSYSYDFRVEKILVELDPTATHNIIWTPFGNHVSSIGVDYHKNKSRVAEENGYRCIHIFDWNDKSKVIKLLGNREKLYARNCSIKEVGIDDTGLFLKENHLQGSCRGQSVRIGLYCEGEIVAIMTFGRPRYNKNYEWELIRYCSNKYVIGGAEKLFKNFINTYNPESVISYCDRSKFIGSIYKTLGFTRVAEGEPSCIWYNIRNKKFFTDNLVRQRGVDQLLGLKYGKGVSNRDLLLQEGYLPVYDCGQDTWVYKNK